MRRNKKNFTINKKRGRPQKHLIKKTKRDNKNKNIKSLFNNSNIKLEKYINYKTQSRKEE